MATKAISITLYSGQTNDITALLAQQISLPVYLQGIFLLMIVILCSIIFLEQLSEEWKERLMTKVTVFLSWDNTQEASKTVRLLVLTAGGFQCFGTASVDLWVGLPPPPAAPANPQLPPATFCTASQTLSTISILGTIFASVSASLGPNTKHSGKHGF